MLSLFIGCACTRVLPMADASSAEPPGIKTIYVIPSSHANLGGPMHGEWRGEIAKLWKKDIIDNVLEACQAEPKLCWTIGAFWMFQAWWDNTPDREPREALLELVRQGRISISAPSHNYRSAHMPAELVNRVCYDSHAMTRTRGIDLETAVMNDVPGWNWSLVQPLAKSGVRYFLAGVNTFAGGRLDLPPQHNPFWWQAPDGSRVLTWISDSYTEAMTRVFVDPTSARFFAGMGSLQGFEKKDLPRLAAMDNQEIMEFGIRRKIDRLEKAGYPYDSILLLHAHDFVGPDGILGAMEHFRAWNATHESPQIVVSTPETFFRHIEQNFADHIPTHSGDWAGIWETNCQADPYLRALRNRVDHHAPALETLASLSEVLDITPYPVASLKRLNALHLELHDQGVVGDPAVLEAAQITTDLTRFLLGRFAAAVTTQEAAIVVFNPSSWPRGGIVRVSIPHVPRGPWHLYDPASDAAVAPLEGRPTHFSFIASDVPPIGYKVFLVRPGAATKAADVKVIEQDHTIENRFYRLRVDPDTGDIASIFDREARRELVDANSPWRFNRLAASPSGYLGLREALAHSIDDISFANDPTGPMIRIRRSGTPHAETEIRLPAAQRRIEIRNHIDIPPDRNDPSVYFLHFPFALDPKKLRLHAENANAFLTPGETYLPGAYRAKFVATGAADLREGDAFGVAIAHPQTSIAFLEGGLPVYVSIVRPVPLIWDNPVGIDPPRRQTFDYAITSSPGQFDPAGTARFGEETAVPLPAFYKPADMFRNPGPLPAAAAGFLSWDARNVVLRTWKKAERGAPDEYLLRLHEVAGKKTTDIEIQSPLRFASATLANMVEEALPDGALATDPLRFSIRAHETVSVRVRIGAPAKPQSHIPTEHGSTSTE